MYPFLLFFGRLTVAKQPAGGYTTYLPKHNFCLYLTQMSLNKESAQTTVVFVDKSRAFAGAEKCLNVLCEQFDEKRFHPIILADFPVSHHYIYETSGAIIKYRADRLAWWMGTDRWQSPPRGTDAFKRIIFAHKLKRLMAKSDAKILHVNLLSRDSWIDLATAKIMGVRTVGHVRSLLSQKPLNSHCLKYCDAVICISDCVTNEITKLTDHSKIIKIYDPVPSIQDLRTAEKDTAKIALSLNADTKVISSIAMLDPRKGHDVAINAFAKIAQSCPQSILLIVGGSYSNRPSTEIDRLKKLAHYHGLSERVKFTGFVVDMHKIYAASDIVLALSKDGEAFGLVPLEAGAHGCVAVATAVGATPELIIDGETGFLVPPDDPDAVADVCMRVLSDVSLAKNIGIAAKEHVEKNFNPEIITRQVEAVYDRLLQK